MLIRTGCCLPICSYNIKEKQPYSYKDKRKNSKEAINHHKSLGTETIFLNTYSLQGVS